MTYIRHIAEFRSLKSHPGRPVLDESGLVVREPDQPDVDEEDAPVIGRADGLAGQGLAAVFLASIGPVPFAADR